MTQVLTIDARGHKCPVPTLKLRRILATCAPGSAVALYADDAMAQIDVPHFCNQNNLLLDGVEQADAYWIFTVRLPD